MIKPSIGRVVWYYPHGKTQQDAGEQPLAAIVAHVHGDDCVNLAIFDANGKPFPNPPTSIHLLQEGAGPRGDTTPFCTWMPYQIGQAKKHEAEASGKV